MVSRKEIEPASTNWQLWSDFFVYYHQDQETLNNYLRNLLYQIKASENWKIETITDAQSSSALVKVSVGETDLLNFRLSKNTPDDAIKHLAAISKLNVNAKFADDLEQEIRKQQASLIKSINIQPVVEPPVINDPSDHALTRAERAQLRYQRRNLESERLRTPDNATGRETAQGQIDSSPRRETAVRRPPAITPGVRRVFDPEEGAQSNQMQVPRYFSEDLKVAFKQGLKLLAPPAIGVGTTALLLEVGLSPSILINNNLLLGSLLSGFVVSGIINGKEIGAYLSKLNAYRKIKKVK